MNEVSFQPNKKFVREVKRALARVMLMQVCEPGVLRSMGHDTDYTEADVRKQFGDDAAQAWSAVKSSRAAFLRAVDEHLDRPRVKHHMGQIIAECDCPHPDKCNRADRCTATRTKD